MSPPDGAAEIRRIIAMAEEATAEPSEPWPVMDPEAYYGLPGDIVRAIEPHSEADPVALLVQFLTAFGSAVGRGPYYQVEGDRRGTNLDIRDLFGRHRGGDQIGRALGVLAERGLARRVKRDGTGGRPSEIWYATGKRVWTPPVDASGICRWLSACGQVLTCVRP